MRVVQESEPVELVRREWARGIGKERRAAYCHHLLLEEEIRR